MVKEKLHHRVFPSNIATSSSSLDVESINSFGDDNDPGFKFSNRILTESKEIKPCEPDEIFDCLKFYFFILKAAGVYFENPKEMEEIKRKQKERIRLTMKKSIQQRRGKHIVEEKLDDKHELTEVTNAIFTADLNIRDSKEAKLKQILSKAHRIYCTVLLIFHWTNVVRACTMFTPDDTFGPDLFFKMVVIVHLTMSAGMVTSFYWACARGRFATVMIGLSGLKGIDPHYLRRLGRTGSWICGWVLGLNMALMLFGYFKLEWMYRPLGAPINTWIITDDKNLQLTAQVTVLLILFYVPLASFFITSFVMVLSMILRRSFILIKEDLKSSMALISSVEEKKAESISRPGTSRSRGARRGTAVMTDAEVEAWKFAIPDRIANPYSSQTTRRTSTRLNEMRPDSRSSLTFELLRQRYQFVTKLVRKADKFVSICNACGIAGYLSEMILLLYTLLWYSCRFKEAATYLATLSFWLLNAVASLSYMSFSAVLVNNAAQRVFEKIHDVDLSRYSLDILNQFSIFLTRMTTDNIGFSVVHLFVIDRNTILTIVGLFLTYFLLIYQLNPSNDDYCILNGSVEKVTNLSKKVIPG